MKSLPRPETITCVRLILGDQLNASHPWFQRKEPGVIYVLAELLQELCYTRHHIQKVAAFFLAMQNFAQALTASGHNVQYFALEETAQFATLNEWLSQVLKQYPEAIFEYQQPDEYRVARQLATFCAEWPTATACVDSEHFFLPFAELGDYIQSGRAHKMETFYRKMRQRFQVLMANNRPLGDAWNFDKENRKSLSKDDIAHITAPKLFCNDVSDIVAKLEQFQIKTIGHIAVDEGKAVIPWPVTRTQAKQLLDYFIQHCLAHFGDFQDAMTCQTPHAWSLYHSRLAFALNSKMLSPRYVVTAVEQAFYRANGALPLASVEGFIRQILGWREFVRGIYWLNMPNYTTLNTLNADRALPHYFWTGKTHMRCMQAAIGQSLDYAYAHHIQRLTVTGSFCLMAGINPSEVEAWYLGIYVDALEWVESPNTRGMALFADGGLMATKPYAVSGNYIHKMSDYCEQCTYCVTKKAGEGACPFNSLYWHFIDTHRERLLHNPRTAMIVRGWLKRSDDDRKAILQQAQVYLSRLNTL